MCASHGWEPLSLPDAGADPGTVSVRGHRNCVRDGPGRSSPPPLRNCSCPVFLNLLSEPCFPVQFHNQAFGFYASLPEGKRTRRKEGCRTQARREGRRSLGRAPWPGRCLPLRVGVSPPASCSPPLVLNWYVESGFLMEWNGIEGKY